MSKTEELWITFGSTSEEITAAAPHPPQKKKDSKFQNGILPKIS
jgi:hypothetical protein